MKDESMAEDLLRRDTAVRFDEIFADTTCVKANIHFPVDWVLLRDATRTLMKAVALIRSQGLRHRMDTPQSFMRRMNALCIEMTHTRKKKDGKKMRKTVLRRMKRLMKTVEGHARTYPQLLDERWSETGWSEAQAQDVLERIKNSLDQLPKAVHQAHERIIGEHGNPASFTGDRGFVTKANRVELEELAIFTLNGASSRTTFGSMPGWPYRIDR